MSQHSLAAAAAASEPVEEQVRRLARAKLAEADAVLRQLGGDWLPPPFNPFMVAQALGIRCRPTADRAVADAAIFVKDGDPTILYRRRRSPVKTYYNLFHEIAHTLFPAYRRDFLYGDGPRLFGPRGQLEYLCNIAATEFLMPMDLFAGDLRQGGFSADLVPYLCQRYQAEAEDVCQRMVEADGAACALVLYEPKRQKRGRGKAAPVCFSYALASGRYRSAGLPLATEAALRRHNCIVQAGRSRKPVSAVERLGFAAGAVDCRVEALPLTERPRQNGSAPVLAFLYPA